MNLAWLLERAATFKESTLSVRSGLSALTVKSFPEFVADVRSLQAGLREIGLQKGHIVGVQAASSYEFIVWDLALIDMGAIPHVFPEEWALADMQSTASRDRFAFFVSQQAGTLVLGQPAAGGSLSDYVRVLQSAVRTGDADLLSRVYSSGTTGTLKGLLITRKGAEDLATEFIETFGITQADRFLFFLPLSHFQQRLTVYMCLFAGTSLMHTPFTHVFHDIPRFQPTFLLNPPIFYETALATLMPRISGAGNLADLNAGFGGKLRFMITGMAPIRRNVLEAYDQFGVPLLEAYGITEVGSVTWNVPGSNRIGTVGRPLRNHRIILSPDSEVLVRARNPLCKGYFEAAEGEAERTFLPDGVIATGDVGQFEDGYLVLKGRNKDIVVTSAGVKFHPSELEGRILTLEAIRQAVVISDPVQGDVVAVMSVDDPHDPQLIASADRLVQQINDSVPTYKRIVRTVLTRTRFTVDNGMLTRNLKPNRKVIGMRFVTDRPYAAAAHQ